MCRAPDRTLSLWVAIVCTVSIGCNIGDPDGVDEWPDSDAYFNYPAEDGTPDKSLEDKLIELLEATPAGARVRVALYRFDRTRMARAFGRAHDRGVDVRFVLGNTNVEADCRDKEAVAILEERLGDRRVNICRECESSGGCIGRKINHNKFMTFSELDDGSHNVVVQTSANLTEAQIREFNNMVVVRDDRGLYQAYVDYWRDLQFQDPNDDYYQIVNGDVGTRAFFFPRARGDTVDEILEGVDCQQGSRVRLVMGWLANGRGDVVGRLADMQQQGCQVAALLGDQAEGVPHRASVEQMRDAGVDVGVYHRQNEVTIHSKYLLVDGSYNGEQNRLLWTGSHNITRPALRSNDETLLEIDDPSTFEAFERDSRRIHDRIAVDRPL